MVGYVVQMTDRMATWLLILQWICLLFKLTTACDSSWTWDKKDYRVCSTPTGSAGLWMCENGNVGCYDCDVGERWDPDQESCQKCGGSMTSCKRNISPSACSECKCEKKETIIAAELLESTPRPTKDETTAAPDPTILTTLSSLKTSVASAKVMQPAKTTTHSSSDDDDKDGGGDDNDDCDDVKTTTNEYNPSVTSQSDNKTIIIALAIVLVIIVVIGILLFCYCRRRRSSSIPNGEEKPRPRRNRRFDDEAETAV